MALTRTELLARGLVRAQELTGKDVPVVSLLDNPNISSLSPEEKVEIIKRYSELTGHDVEYHGTPIHKEIGRGAMYGAGLAVPFAMMSGKLTFPPPSVARDILKGGKKPLLEAAKRVGVPLAKVMSLGAMVGGTYGLLQGQAKANTNKYLTAISKNISSSENEDEKRITAAALLAATPHLSKSFQATGDIMRSQTAGNLPGMIGRIDPHELFDKRFRDGNVSTIPPEIINSYQGTPEWIEETYPPGSIGQDDLGNTVNLSGHPTGNVKIEFKHDDWRHVEGLPRSGFTSKVWNKK